MFILHIQSKQKTLQIRIHFNFLQELYSHYYNRAAVMFASCPNFTDHYSEDTINNNGLEWMRFLNEILSDYDDLLNDPRFSGYYFKTHSPHVDRLF